MENNQTQLVSPQAIFQSEKANVDVAIATAQAYPRNIKRSTNNAIATVTLSDEIAQSCTYALPRGGKSISGPSVHLARILAQSWGNMRVSARVVQVEESYLVSEGVCWDLENNLAIQVSVKRRITDRNGKRYNDDMIAVTGNAGNSIALRNAILSVVPKAVTETVYKTALQHITGDLSDEKKLIAKREKVLKGFKENYNVTEDEVLAVIGKQSVENITVDSIATLIGIAQALKDGDTTVNETFRKERVKKDTAKIQKEKEIDRFKRQVHNCKTLEELDELHDIVTSTDGLKEETMNGYIDIIRLKMKEIAEQPQNK